MFEWTDGRVCVHLIPRSRVWLRSYGARRGSKSPPLDMLTETLFSQSGNPHEWRAGVARLPTDTTVSAALLWLLRCRLLDAFETGKLPSKSRQRIFR